MTQNKIIGGALLIAGTCIGAGMLGLPVRMAPSGIISTILCFLGVWWIMTLSALAFAEASIAVKNGNNLISMASYTLGTPGKIVSWITYVFFFYSLMAAYVAGGTSMTAGFINLELNNFLPKLIFMVLFIAPFMIVVGLGQAAVDKLNKFLVIGLKVSFLILAIKVFFVKNTSQLELDFNNNHPEFLLSTLPLVVTSFGYHLLIPSLKSYVNNDPQTLKKSILYGGVLPLILYAIWITIVYLRVPIWGTDGLVSILKGNVDPLEKLIHAFGTSDIYVRGLIGAFSFFALTSSLLGVGLALFDFLIDGTKLNVNKSQNKIILLMLTFAVPVIFTLSVKDGFLIALDYAGVFGSILLIILPALMVWSLRYNKKITSAYQAPVGKALLIFLLVFGLAVIGCEVFGSFGLLPKP